MDAISREHEGAEAILRNAGLSQKAFFRLYLEFVAGKGRVSLREGARFDEMDIAAQTRDERRPREKTVRLGDKGEKRTRGQAEASASKDQPPPDPPAEGFPFSQQEEELIGVINHEIPGNAKAKGKMRSRIKRWLRLAAAAGWTTDDLIEKNLEQGRALTNQAVARSQVTPSYREDINRDLATISDRTYLLRGGRPSA